MEGLFVLLALVPIALLVLLVVTLNRLGGLSRQLELTRRRMEELAAALSERGGSSPTSETPSVEEVPSAQDTCITRPMEVVMEEAPLAEALPEFAADEPFQVGPDHHEPLRQPSPAPRPSFLERHPDLEKFIGENLINKIGIAVLVVGIGLLMRYAIGRGLISETGRTIIGLAAGGVLVGFGHRLRDSLRAFSSVLVAGGIAVFYFSIAIAFHQYHIIGQTPAFLIMVGISGLGVLLTLAYDRKELAVIALLGGFATPFMASTGEGNFRILFTYLLILNAGMLVLSNYKKWLVVNVLAFGLTTVIYGAWMFGPYATLDPLPAWPALGFATGFFLVFFTMNLRYNLRHQTTFGVLDHALLLLNTAAYYGAGMHLLGDVQPKLNGLFTVFLGLFHLGFALAFHRRMEVPRPLLLLLIGLVLTFVSLAAPVQLEGSAITLFWAAEAVLLFWFAQRSGVRLVERTGVLVGLLMVFSLAMDLSDVYGPFSEQVITPLLNKGWTTGVFASLALGAIAHLLGRLDPGLEVLPTVRASILRNAALIAGVVALYLTNLLELQAQLLPFVDGAVVTMALMAYSLAFLLVLDTLAQKLPRSFRIVLAVLTVIAALVYVTGFHDESLVALTSRLAGTGGSGSYLVHYLAFAGIVAAVVRLAILARILIGRGRRGWDLYLWAMCLYLVVLASRELDLVMLWASPPDDLSLLASLADKRRAGYPLLWGVGSFLFMWYGMRQRMRMVRVIALCLFAITLLKLFLVDLGALSEGGRVAAFILLGALLLVISFMYQRLKGLLKDDGPLDPEPPQDA